MNPNYNLVSNLGVIKDSDVKNLTGGIIDMSHLPEDLYLNIGTNNYVQSVSVSADDARPRPGLPDRCAAEVAMKAHAPRAARAAGRGMRALA